MLVLGEYLNTCARAHFLASTPDSQAPTHLAELLELLHAAAPELHAARAPPPEVGTWLGLQLGLFLRPLFLRQAVRDLRGGHPTEGKKM